MKQSSKLSSSYLQSNEELTISKVIQTVQYTENTAKDAKEQCYGSG